MEVLGIGKHVLLCPCDMLAALCAREHEVARDSEDGVCNDAKSLPRLPKAPACEHGLWEDCREDGGGLLASPQAAIEESTEEDALGGARSDARWRAYRRAWRRVAA